MRGGRILWGQIAVVFTIVLVMVWAATQWTAFRLRFQLQLGNPWFELAGWPVYYPPAFFWWWFSFDAYAPAIFVEGAIIAASGGFIAIAAAILMSIIRAREARNVATYGSARWAEDREIRAAGLLGPDGVVLGRYDRHYLRHDGPEHVLCFAPTRSGKGVGLVVPTLLTWPGSCIVHDIKGENWTLTAGFRAQHGRVLLFDPTNARSSAYNPLLEVRQGEWEVRDVQNIADILVDPEGSLDKRNHWEKTSHSLLVGAILHVLYAEKDKTLAGVANFLSDPRRPVEATLRAMMDTPHLGEAGVHPVIASSARELLNKSENERSGVLSTAMSFRRRGLERHPRVPQQLPSGVDRTPFRERPTLHDRTLDRDPDHRDPAASQCRAPARQSARNLRQRNFVVAGDEPMKTSACINHLADLSLGDHEKRGARHLDLLPGLPAIGQVGLDLGAIADAHGCTVVYRDTVEDRLFSFSKQLDALFRQRAECLDPVRFVRRLSVRSVDKPNVARQAVEHRLNIHPVVGVDIPGNNRRHRIHSVDSSLLILKSLTYAIFATAFAITLAGCATNRTPQFSYDASVPPLPTVQAAATDNTPRPLHVPPAWTVARGGTAAGTPTGRVENANAAARVEPRREGYYNAIQIYPWTEGALYQVYAAVGQITTIALEPGESLTGAGPIAAGDTTRWIIGDTESGSGANRRVHILVKPTRPDISTNLVVTTDRRTYMLELRARESLYMPAVAWAYPAPPAGQRQTVPAAPIIPAEAARNYRYGLQVQGDSPPWRPVSVFDDGRRVYIVFPAGIVQGEMPPIFVLGANGEPQIVNSRVHQNVLIVDRLFGTAELRLGSGNRQQTVRIVRTNPTQAAAQPASATTGGSSS